MKKLQSKILEEERRVFQGGCDDDDDDNDNHNMTEMERIAALFWMLRPTS